MQTLSTLLQQKEIKVLRSRRSEYSDLMSKFLERLNPMRVFNGFTPLNYGRLGREFKRAGIPQSHLYAFYEECERAKNFHAFFWWKLKDLKSKRK